MISAETRLIDLTVGELMDLITSKISPAPAPAKDYTEKKYVYGLAGIAKLLGCSIRTASDIKASGKIDGAIIQEGRKIIVDSELALNLLKK